MQSFSFSFEGCTVCCDELCQSMERCKQVIKTIRNARTLQYNSQYASINLPFDEQLRIRVKNKISDVTRYDPAILIVIGIGGSNLGTRAVQEAMWGADNTGSGIKVYYADTVDPEKTLAIKQQADCVLRNGGTVILNIVTKSGTTVETVAHAAIFVELLKMHNPDRYKDWIVVTTDHGSPLYTVAQRESWHVLEIPKLVGGRFSVLSAVGLFPLGLMGIDIDDLCNGAADVVNSSVMLDNESDEIVKYAALLDILYRRGYVIHNFFTFAPELQGIGFWYRQLMAESLGKKYSRTGELVHTGITPTVSVGSTDLHSIVELHLGGPFNTSTLFVHYAEVGVDLCVPDHGSLSGIVPYISGKSYTTIMDAILSGTKYAYASSNRPYITMILARKSAFVIGQLLQCKMLEIMYFGWLLNVDPFIQPQVELYKNKTRQLLA